MNQNMAASIVALALLCGCGLHKERPDGSGAIECTQVSVAPQVAGLLLKLPPQEGDLLKKGELVAQLDARDYEIRRAEAQGAVQAAQARLDLMLAGSRDEDIQRAKDQAAEAEAMSKAADADLQRIRKVYESGSGTQKQMDDARAQADRTAAALSAAQQMFQRLKQGNREEEVRLARAELEQVQARLAAVEKAVSDCTVTAPMEGVVTTRVREEGEYAGVGTPLLTISRLDEVWLSVYVPEARIAGVKIGQSARVKVDGDPTMYEGRVTFISPEAEFTPRNVQTPDERAKLVYRVKVTLKNTEGVFKPGMPADGYL